MGSFCSFVLLFLMAFTHSTLQAYSPRCPSVPTSKNTVPLSLFSLPTSFPRAQSLQDAVALEQIRNTLGLYPLSIDGKNFDALEHVFTPDAVANYSAPFSVLRSLPTIKATLKKVLAPVDSQHMYGTQVVEIRHGGCEAAAVTYFTANQFGRGTYAGEVLYSYGQYQDTLVRIPSGEWRIKERNLVYMVRVTNWNLQP